MDQDYLALIEQVQKGDRSAWDGIWRQFQEVALALAYGRLGDRSLAADVAQDVFQIAIEKIGSLGDPRKFPGWLRTITLNEASKHGKRLRRAIQPPSDADWVAPNLSAERAISNRCMSLLLPLLEDIMPRLSEMHRSILQMSFLQGMSDTAIGPVVQRNNGSVGRAKQKALAQLKEFMQEAAVRHPDARECVDHLLG
jgi:RNA polymerase sigma factor (sigma-70 family)